MYDQPSCRLAVEATRVGGTIDLSFETRPRHAGIALEVDQLLAAHIGFEWQERT